MRRRKRLIAFVLIFSAGIVVAYFTLGERVTRASLSHSVASQVGLSFYGSCHRAGAAGAWTCALVSTDGSEGGITYAVEQHGRCWTGSKIADGGITGLPPKVSGCIGLLDQLRTGDHIGSGAGSRPPGFY